MKVVYLAHALAANTREGIEANRARAAKWAAWVLKTYRHAVIADWIWCTGEFEETPENRELGLQMDVALVGRCDEMWMVGERISAGMRVEATEALRLGRTVYDLTATTMNALPPGTPYTRETIESFRWTGGNP